MIEVSSTPRLASVIGTSVVNGVISVTVVTKVVLPTPKPPAMTILTDVGPRRAAVAAPAPLGAGASERFDSIKHFLEEGQVVVQRHRPVVV